MSEQSLILEEGTRQLSGHQTITFTKYVRQILPSDGFVFWVKASLYNDVPLPHTLTVNGSFHDASNQEMREDENIAVTQVMFTTQTEIENFATVDSSEIWLGTFNNVRFSFTRRGKFYANAATYHYYGDAIYPAFESQIIDYLEDIDLTDTVASNSIPFWLELESIPLYPSYLIPTNLPPPYGSIHIDRTESLQASYSVDNSGSLDNWAKEQVRITLYGANNNKAFDFLNEVQKYCLFTENFGINNTPTIQDEKRPQSDINAIAQKKTITFVVNYHQSRLDLLIRRMLLNATINDSKPDFVYPDFYFLIDQANDLAPLTIDDLTTNTPVIDVLTNY